MVKTIRAILVIGLVCLTYLGNMHLVYGAETTNNSTQCQQLREDLQSISNDIGWIYKVDSRIYGAFSNVLVVNNLPVESINVQKRLQDVFEVAQRAQTKLQNVYISVCTKQSATES